jgi:hypothetical protein
MLSETSFTISLLLLPATNTSAFALILISIHTDEDSLSPICTTHQPRVSSICFSSAICHVKCEKISGTYRKNRLPAKFSLGVVVVAVSMLALACSPVLVYRALADCRLARLWALRPIRGRASCATLTRASGRRRGRAGRGSLDFTCQTPPLATNAYEQPCQAPSQRASQLRHYSFSHPL